MTKLTKKQQRTIDFALDRLFGRKSLWVPKSINDIPGKDFFTRQLRLTGERIIFLTDAGLAHMRSIVATIYGADAFDGLAGYSDIWAGCHHILENLLSKEIRPDNAAELLELLREQIGADISNYSYAVPLFGVEMDGIDAIALGPMKIVHSPVPHLEAARAKHAHTDLPGLMEATKGYLWLLGSARGTPRVAQEKFREQAALAAGMLAVSAASMYERGASPFRIGVVMSQEEAHGRAIWLSWNDHDLELTTHYMFSTSQLFTINTTLAEQFAAASTFARAFKIFSSDKRTQLEDAITKAIYWFSDAHRDPVSVMRLIKYWSCVETFFSAERKTDTNGKSITRSVSTGLTTVLVYGGYEFVPETEYFSFKKRVAKLYDLRSSAVHRAAYDHVSERDVDNLSQWVAWMLINMISFVERGYRTIGQIKAIADRLDDELIAKSKRS